MDDNGPDNLSDAVNGALMAAAVTLRRSPRAPK